LTDRDLVRLHWPAELRPAFDALFGIDDALGDVVAAATQPALGAIKLAWWKESLERLDSAPAPAEPRLRAVAETLLPQGIGGRDVAELVAGWSTLLDAVPEDERVAIRGAMLFALAGRLLRVAPPGLHLAGALFAGVATARRLKDVRWLRVGGDPAPLRFPRQARPLTALGALARRDSARFDRHGWEAEATPGRSLTILRHRLSGLV
jgi:phytoene synthase